MTTKTFYALIKLYKNQKNVLTYLNFDTCDGSN